MTGVQTCALPIYAARDPVWTADGFVSERWLPVSPVTGRLDAFQWKVPVAELSERPLLEAEPEGPAPALPREVPSPPLGNVAPEPAPAAAMPAAAPVGRAPMRPAPIIPLAQVPDDPGPEPEDAELVTPGPWQRIRQLFR